jgi:hypothetical protein
MQFGRWGLPQFHFRGADGHGALPADVDVARTRLKVSPRDRFFHCGDSKQSRPGNPHPWAYTGIPVVR